MIDKMFTFRLGYVTVNRVMEGEANLGIMTLNLGHRFFVNIYFFIYHMHFNLHGPLYWKKKREDDIL